MSKAIIRAVIFSPFYDRCLFPMNPGYKTHIPREEL